MPGLGDAPGGPDELLAELARWSADDRVARAAAERSRTRSLVGQAAAGATWLGLLVDLAESEAEVAVAVAGGPRLAGRVVAAGRDFVVLYGRGGRPTLIAVTAIASIAALAGSRGTAADGGGASGGPPLRPGGRRSPALTLSLASALDALAVEEAPVVLHCGAEAVAGYVVACGQDVVTLRGEGAGRHPVYVPLAAVKALELR